MENCLFASDLDNTLLFSYKNRREGDVCVEWLEGREQGYFTQQELSLLAQVNTRMLFIPVTSRSIQQYRRICFPTPCRPRYAVTTNGAILLEDGKVDPAWQQESVQAVAPWQKEVLRVEALLPAIQQAKRFRIVDGMYLFAACDTPQDAQEASELLCGKTALNVCVSGRKLYFFPPPLHKGAAVQRLRERFSPQGIICAGDSPIDAPMFLQADAAVVPDRALLPDSSSALPFIHTGQVPFGDFVLQCALEFAQKKFL